MIDFIYNCLINIYFYSYKYIFFGWIKLKKNNPELLRKYYFRIGKEKLFKNYLFKSPKKSFKKQTRIFWFHAVSGGEVILVDKLIKKFLPQNKIVVSYMSGSAATLAKALFLNNKQIKHFYLPLDKAVKVNQLVQNIKPYKFFVIEHDAWPNLLKELKKNNTPSYMLNFKFKAKDFFYFKKFPAIFLFTHRFDFFFTQDEASYKKVKFLSKNKFKLENLGNIKYNFFINNPLYSASTKNKFLLMPSVSLVALGSSHPEEEDLVVNALLNLIKKKKIKLIIVPRHIERSEAILSQLKKKYLFLKGEIITDYKKINLNSDIFILKKYGKLKNVYQIATINLVGDSFIKSQGGHNILESIALKKPTFYGKYYQSFPELTKELEKEIPEIRLEPSQIEAVVLKLLNNQTYYNKLANVSFKKLRQFSCNEAKLFEIFS